MLNGLPIVFHIKFRQVIELRFKSMYSLNETLCSLSDTTWLPGAVQTFSGYTLMPSEVPEAGS